jgi:hypothetical protein
MSNWTRSTCKYGITTHAMGAYTVHQVERETVKGRYKFWSVELNNERIAECESFREAKWFAQDHSR